MAFKIGFTAEKEDKKEKDATCITPIGTQKPRKSLVQVYFKEKNTTLPYYNDRFDLRCGDLVYVEGKLEGIRGRVTGVSYSFKIKLSEYKRVIHLIDTEVHGNFFMAGSHFVTFERGALAPKQALSWFKAPPTDEEEFVSSKDKEDSFPLNSLVDMNVSAQIAERGHEYYVENRVKYISLDGRKGYAIVEGNESYEVEFEYADGIISSILCTCFCSGKCKHEFAAMLQLQETLAHIEKNYAEDFSRQGYFAAIAKGTLFELAIDSKENGSFKL